MKKLITYTEASGKKPFNWNEFLYQKNKTKAEKKSAYDKACNWVTCACGNQCDTIPRSSYGVPTDQALYHLGHNFMCRIRDHHWDDAKQVLSRIEQRSAELIKEIETQK